MRIIFHNYIDIFVAMNRDLKEEIYVTQCKGLLVKGKELKVIIIIII